MTTEPEVNFYFFAEESYIRNIGLLLQQIYSQSLQHNIKTELNIEPIKKISPNNRIFIFCCSSSQMRQYDEALWTYAQLSFLPHATENDPILGMQPIVLGTKLSSIDQAGGRFSVLLCMPEAWASLGKEFSSISGIQKIIVPMIMDDKYNLEENMQKMVSQYFEEFRPTTKSINIFYKDTVKNSWIKKSAI